IIENISQHKRPDPTTRRISTHKPPINHHNLSNIPNNQLKKYAAEANTLATYQNIETNPQNIKTTP
ncbi:hypothetical protein AAHH80_40640, partial [Burkholderia pseudomallei]